MLSDPTANRGLALFSVAMSLIAWVVLIRPRVVAHANGVLLRNIVRDTLIPWSCVERVKVLQTLQVVTPTQTYHGLGVSRSARSMLRESRGQVTPGFFGVGSSGVFGRSYPAEARSTAAQQQVGGTYQAYVESRLRDFAKGKANVAAAQPVGSWAVLPLAALVVAAVCGVLIVL